MLLAWGTFEIRERAQKCSGAVPVLVQQDTHEDESKHDHLTNQPCSGSPRLATGLAHRSVSTANCTVQAKGTAAHRADRTRDDESLICALYFECERNPAGDSAIARERLQKE